jgi:hypothetical protein
VLKLFVIKQELKMRDLLDKNRATANWFRNRYVEPGGQLRDLDATNHIDAVCTALEVMAAAYEKQSQKLSETIGIVQHQLLEIDSLTDKIANSKKMTEIEEVQQKLRQAGVRDIKIYLNENAKGKPISEVKADVANVLNAYLDGAFSPMPKFGDSKGQITKEKQ